MNICMLSIGHSVHDDRLFYKETVSLAKLFKNIILVMPGKHSDFEEKECIRYIPLNKTGSKFSLIPLALKTVLKINPDVCHIHDYELIFIIPIIRLLTKCKVVYDVYEVYPEMVLQAKHIPSLLKPLVSKFVDVMEKVLSRYAHYVITADDNIHSRFNKSCRHVTTLFNYPRLSFFIANKNKLLQLKERYKGKIPIIYQGSMSEVRGLFKMIEAMAILKSENSSVVLILIGEMNNKLLKQVIELIEKLGLDEHIDLLGEISHLELVNYISIAKVGLVPLLPTEKYKKNIPTKQFEYMICGVPVLGANLPPITSYVLFSGCGKIYDSTSARALASGVLDIISDEAAWQKMSDAGRKAVLTNWNWEKMEERLLSVYEKLIQM